MNMFSVTTETGRTWDFYCIIRAEAFAVRNVNAIRSWK